MDQQTKKKFEIYLRNIFIEYKVVSNYQYVFGPYNKYTIHALANLFFDFKNAIYEVESVYDLLLNLGKW